MGRVTPITAVDVATVVHRMAQGERLDEICPSIGRAASAMRPLLKELGYPTRTTRPKPVITKADVEAELAKLRNGHAPVAVRQPAPPGGIAIHREPPAWPTKGRLAQVLFDATRTAKDRIKLADEISRITLISQQQATQSVNKLTSGTTSSLSTDSALNLCKALGIDPEAIWPDWEAAS